jgi:hypothetical protein
VPGRRQRAVLREATSVHDGGTDDRPDEHRDDVPVAELLRETPRAAVAAHGEHRRPLGERRRAPLAQELLERRTVVEAELLAARPEPRDLAVGIDVGPGRTPARIGQRIVLGTGIVRGVVRPQRLTQIKDPLVGFG